MNKILIVGASVLQLPAILKAKELGLYVGVVDYDPNAIGITYADEYFNVSTIDIDGVVQVAQEFNPKGIMTMATDMPMRSIAAATSVLNLPGISERTSVLSTDKGEMIKAFKTYNVPSPWFFLVKSRKELLGIKSRLNYPCIIKPTDNSGSRGVSLANTFDELLQMFDYAKRQSREGELIIEEYLEGSEVSVEVMVFRGEVSILAITDKLTTGAPHFVEIGHSQPSRHSSLLKEQICLVAKQAVNAVGLQNGPAHVEMMLTKDGPRMIELGARMGGDCITSHLVPLSTGVDMIKATIDVALGIPPSLLPSYEKAAAIRFISTKKGKITSIEGYEAAMKIEGIQEITFTKKVGDSVTEIQSSVDRIGFIIAQANTAPEAITICEKALKMININVE